MFREKALNGMGVVLFTKTVFSPFRLLDCPLARLLDCSLARLFDCSSDVRRYAEEIFEGVDEVVIKERIEFN